MTTQTTAPVVVGYDGSLASMRAVELGAALAMFHHARLRIVHAYAWPILFASLANLAFRPDDWTVAPSARAMLDKAGARALADHPGLGVDVEVRPGLGAPVLLAEAAHAFLIVVGRRGVGGVTGVLAGPVIRELAARAACPVVVVGAPAHGSDRPRSRTFAPDRAA